MHPSSRGDDLEADAGAEAEAGNTLQSAMLRPATIPAMIVLLCGLACAPTGEPPRPAGMALRFIGEDAVETLNPDHLYDATQVVRWDLSRPDEAARWRPRDGGAIERSVQIDADTVDRIEVRIAGQPVAEVGLSWAGPLRRFSTERAVEATGRDAGDGSERVFSFDLRGHPWWTGRIARLRIAPLGDDGEQSPGLRPEPGLEGVGCL